MVFELKFQKNIVVVAIVIKNKNMSELIFNVYSIVFGCSLLVTAILTFANLLGFENFWDWFCYSALWPLHLLKSLVKSFIKIIS